MWAGWSAGGAACWMADAAGRPGSEGLQPPEGTPVRHRCGAQGMRMQEVATVGAVVVQDLSGKRKASLRRGMRPLSWQFPSEQEGLGRIPGTPRHTAATPALGRGHPPHNGPQASPGRGKRCPQTKSVGRGCGPGRARAQARTVSRPLQRSLGAPRLHARARAPTWGISHWARLVSEISK